MLLKPQFAGCCYNTPAPLTVSLLPLKFIHPIMSHSCAHGASYFLFVFVIWRWTLKIWRLSVPELHMRTCEDASGPTDFSIVLFWLTDVKVDVLYRCHLQHLCPSQGERSLICGSLLSFFFYPKMFIFLNFFPTQFKGRNCAARKALWDKQYLRVSPTKSDLMMNQLNIYVLHISRLKGI